MLYTINQTKLESCVCCPVLTIEQCVVIINKSVSATSLHVVNEDLVDGVEQLLDDLNIRLLGWVEWVVDRLVLPCSVGSVVNTKLLNQLMKAETLRYDSDTPHHRAASSVYL